MAELLIFCRKLFYIKNLILLILLLLILLLKKKLAKGNLRLLCEFLRSCDFDVNFASLPSSVRLDTQLRLELLMTH